MNNTPAPAGICAPRDGALRRLEGQDSQIESGYLTGEIYRRVESC